MDQTMKMALAELAKTAGNSPDRKSAFAEMIMEVIRPNDVTLNLFNLFLPTRQLAEGDMLQKRLLGRGFPVYTMVPGTNHLAAVPKPHRDVISYAIDTLVVKVRMNSIEVRRGELYTIEEIRADMERSLTNEIISRVWQLIGSIWNGNTHYTNYVDATSGLTYQILDGMLNTVNRTAGTVRGIYGTQAALRPIYNFAGLVERTAQSGTPPTLQFIPVNPILEEWARTGRVASYKGVPIIEIPQVFAQDADGYDKPLIKEDRIYVIGDNAGEIILYGGVESQDHMDYTVEPADYVLAMWRKFGVIVDRADRIGYIKVAEPSFPYRILP